ncbi:hypothetical protein JI721_15120 [Alicyclobacillus cycloheptanicus]|uniref:HNH endonuclease n=1 Tax=Alicyclobacillus cycloheptanicus TaxID=1457 RepID=A0ABT9XDQ3_9BACL|nr:hypothetical protein [Alicyclobacillus cycloheptanicus]MDQ0188270.1 hypothetical protein [Alicyclobacillus cycloheptanicus]WDM00989.1 hypothetical protein JI721_15120 [Alicyclobacillus cycloheptanicus]
MKNDFEPLDDGSILVYLQQRDGEQFTTIIDCGSLVKLQGINRRWYAAKMHSGIQVVARSDSPNGRLMYLSRVLAETPDELYCEHINGDTTDNRLCNLRNVTVSERMQNRGLLRSNRTGIRGVSLNNKGKYVAQAQLNRQKYYLGLFEELEQAAAVVTAWRRRNMTHSEVDKVQ